MTTALQPESVVIPKTLLIPLGDITAALTAYRRRSGRTQDAVAHRAGRYRKWVSEFEREVFAPTLTRLLAHANALGVDVHIILTPKAR
ncbi:helix-turn-helix domain-containing protein [Mycobacterium sp. C3-094]